MIQIFRSANAPTILRRDGVAARRTTEAQSGEELPIQFNREIYSHDTVKAALIAMQHEKCAFCEAKPLHVSSGDVEHFRPKAAVRQSEDEPLLRPGYYWLAYEWSNLLFACERCNRRHKMNLFPLVEPAKRARSHRAAITDEAPVFIDPSAEDPARCIGFREHVPFAIDGNTRGERTIEALGLKRRELMADREAHLERLRLLAQMAAMSDVPVRLRSQANGLLSKATAPDAEYAAMVRAALPFVQPGLSPTS